MTDSPEKHSTSLLGPEQTELFDADALPSGWELMQIEQRAGVGNYTGERVAKDRERYAGIVRMLAEGVSMSRIARAYRVSRQTVRAIRDNEGLSIVQCKKGIAGNLRAVAEIMSERLLEEADDIPVNQLAVPLAIVVDKMQLLDGEATSRHETMTPRRAPQVEDFEGFLAALPSADIQPVEGGDKSFAKRGPSGGSGSSEGDGAPAAGQGDEEGGPDLRSGSNSGAHGFAKGGAE